MILTLCSWAWIGGAAFLCGFAVLQRGFYKDNFMDKGADKYILTGLCLLTAYAQILSLFDGIGGMYPTGILIAACLLILVCFHRELRLYMLQLVKNLKWHHILTIAVVVIYSAAMASYRPAQYDTDLYHAQAIRWIEQFGVVKGLGNLHNRLAYNSSFFCLQALFGMKFFVNRSLHSMNGFITALMLVYGILGCRFLQGRRPAMSDFFRMGLIWFLGLLSTVYNISSSGSDLLAQALLLYICAEWAGLLERHADAAEFGILCVLAVWAVTIKMSVAMLVLLALYPAANLIKEKRWKQVCLLTGMGMVVALPFLARNVVISGYLLYPFEKLDLFSVDWKMPASVVASDSLEIRAWGRGMTEQADYNAPLSQWLPKWYGDLSAGYAVLLWISLACIPAAIGYTVYSVRRKTEWGGQIILLWSCIAGMIVWFATAPLVRYGLEYFLLLPLFFLGVLSERMSLKHLARAGLILAILWSGSSLMTMLRISGKPRLLIPEEYGWCNVEQAQLEGHIFYVGRDSDIVGYHYFPATTHAVKLERIEFRTGELSGGFRVREEYRNVKLLNNGGILRE